MSPLRRPRSLLYIPGDKPKHLQKAAHVGADRVLLDLEDGVAPSCKQMARQAVRRAALEGLLPEGWLLRLNAAASAEFERDLALARELQPAGLVLPKAESAEAIAALARETESWRPALALVVETAAGVRDVAQLAVQPGVAMLIFGSADYRLSLGAPPSTDREFERYALGQIMVAARAAGCLAYDSVYFRFRDAAGLEAHAALGRKLGFDGKSCIHPAQLDPIHRCYSSTAAETAWARQVLQAWDEQEGEARGVVVLEGEMLEALHLTQAHRILERALG